MNSACLCFFALLGFLFFSSVICQDGNGNRNEATTPSQARIFGLSGLGGINPNLLLFNQLFTGSNVSVSCLLALSPLFGQNALFPTLNSNLLSQATTFGFLSSSNLITFAQLAPFFRTNVARSSQQQLPRVLGTCDNFGDNNSSVLLFLFALLSANAGNFNPVLPISNRACSNYNGFPIQFVDSK